MLFLGQSGWYARTVILSSLVMLNALPHLWKERLSTVVGRKLQHVLRKAQIFCFMLLILYRGAQRLCRARKDPPTLEALRNHFETSYTAKPVESNFVNRDGIIIAYRTIGSGSKVVLP